MENRLEICRTISLTRGDKIQYKSMATSQEVVAMSSTEYRNGKATAVGGTYFHDLRSAGTFIEGETAVSDHEKTSLIEAVGQFFPYEGMDLSPEVLFVDDEEATRQYFIRYYGSEISAICAESYEEAIELLERFSHSIRLIITDQRMPGCRGVELLSVAKVRYPYIARIICTGYADVAETVDAINIGGVHGYLAKPFRKEEWASVLKEALQVGRQQWEDEALARLEIKGLLDALPTRRLTAMKSLCRVLTGSGLDVAMDAYRIAAEKGNTLGMPRIDWKRYDHATLETRESERLGLMGHMAMEMLSGEASLSKNSAIELNVLVGTYPEIFNEEAAKIKLKNKSDVGNFLFGSPDTEITYGQAVLFAVVVAQATRGYVIDLDSNGSISFPKISDASLD